MCKGVVSSQGKELVAKEQAVLKRVDVSELRVLGDSARRDMEFCFSGSISFTKQQLQAVLQDWKVIWTEGALLLPFNLNLAFCDQLSEE